MRWWNYNQQSESSRVRLNLPMIIYGGEIQGIDMGESGKLEYDGWCITHLIKDSVNNQQT